MKKNYKIRETTAQGAPVHLALDEQAVSPPITYNYVFDLPFEGYLSWEE